MDQTDISTAAVNKATAEKASLYSAKSFRFAGVVSLGYLLLSYVLIGFKTDQLILIALFNFLYFASQITRKFVTGFSVFFIFWIIFDYMKAFPNFKYNTVHIGELYHAEKHLFGIHTATGVVTPNEYLAIHHALPLDIFTGMCYLCWVPVPLIFAGYLFFRNRMQFFYFSLTFLLVNIIGFIGYYIYPAAPPWYVMQHGFDFNFATPGNTAGLARFDAFFNVHIFAGLYSKSSNVFAAMPSLHAAYMLIVLYYGIKFRMGWLNLLFAIILGGIWFSAVYNAHHYVLDVLAGISCAILGIALFQWFVNRTGPGNKMMHHLVTITT
ncbi:phosphatase PAP2 family protein [Deminuibacter soli]|uniref:Inositol phosphorylceramide synthase n=1 Tax=Deminuibacter soli TaxID=2291815 RepID=A0A3E1NJC7_9BACT|nr:phosphatase PAP2 family protein [Deminuibacter soli]RFM27888.1 inositol phosphorylceramide synthase [Deminuibacter soli]